MKMKEAKTAVKTHAGKENEPVENTARKKTKEEKPPTKVIVRRLPPSMTEEQFKEQVSPMPDHDYFYFVAADMSLMPNAFSRAYINFIDQNDLFIFTEKFDGYVFLDNKGGEFPAVVEFAPFQRIPKNRPTRKKDSKVGTIEADPVYIAFKERLETENLENKTANNVSKQHFFETSTLEKKEEVSNTPLLDFIRNKRAERQRIRDEKREEKRKKDIERRKAKDEQRKVKKEDEPSVVKTLPSTPVNPNPKTKEASLDDKEKSESPSCVKAENPNSTAVTETTEPSKEKHFEQVDKKVTKMMENFYEAISGTNKDTSKPNNIGNLPSFRKHEDIESEMLKNREKKTYESRESTVFLQQATSPSKLKFTKMSNRPAVCESRGRLQMNVPRKVMFTRNHSDVVMTPVRVNKVGPPDCQGFVRECEIMRPTRSVRMRNDGPSECQVVRHVRPIRINIPLIPGNYKPSVGKPFEVRTPLLMGVPTNQNSRNESYQNTTSNQKSRNSDIEHSHVQNAKFSVSNVSKENSTKDLEAKTFAEKSETLKKNLEKVVANVLDNTKVSSPKEIDKPKTFVRRYSGIGDVCRGRGYNTPNYYLPPRAYGFGMVDNKAKDKSNTARPLSSFAGKTPGKKSLPPFSKKSLYLSKSDGDIDKPETVSRVGGSEESVRKSPQTFVLKRPSGSPAVVSIVGNKK